MAKITPRWISHPFMIPPALSDWLVHCGSLTRRLKRACGAFSVKKVSTRICAANHDEVRELGLRLGEYAYVREVVLYCDDQPVVFAHSVMPIHHLRGPWNMVTRLGARPLGEALFANHQIRRHPLTYQTIHPHHPLHRQALQAVSLQRLGSLFARRSRFTLRGRSLMVTEVFLPAILKVKHGCR